MLIIIAAVWGLQLQVRLFSSTPNYKIFVYFTNLSNLAALVYFVASVMKITFSRNKAVVFLPTIKGMILLCLTATMLVAHFLLGDAFSMGGEMVWTLILVHYVVPFGAIFDWILFDKKGTFKVYAPLLWILAPVIYFIYAMLASRIGNGIGYGSRYPYPFLDIDVLGVEKVLLTSLVMIGSFVVVGYLFFLMDFLMHKIKK